ncbi:10690_t:CDS:2, partial [Paraglomus brasilianum]
IDMDFEKCISDFLNDTALHDWSMNCLRYLERRVLFSSGSKNDIIDAFKRSLEKSGKSSVMYANAKEKAIKLSKNAEEIFRRKKFLTFLVKLTESGKLDTMVGKSLEMSIWQRLRFRRRQLQI